MEINKPKLFKILAVSILIIICVVFIFSLIFKDKDDGKSSENNGIDLTNKEVTSSPNFSQEETEIKPIPEIDSEDYKVSFEPIQTPEIDSTTVDVSDSFLNIVVDENGDTWVDGIKVEENSYNEIYDDDPSNIPHDLIKNAKQIDIGYNLTNYDFRLIDASDSYLLFLANPNVLILHDIYNKKNYELGINVEGGNISEDEKFVVFYKNDFPDSQAFTFNITNPNVRPIKTISNGEFTDIEMVKGHIFMTFNYYDVSNDFKITTQPITDSIYEFDENKNLMDSVDGVGIDSYVDSNNNVIINQVTKNIFSSFKVSEPLTEIASSNNIAPVSDVIVENNQVFSNTYNHLFINGNPTPYKNVNSFAYLNGTLYFVDDILFYSYKDGNYEEIMTHKYNKNVISGGNSLYLVTYEGIIYKIF